MSHYSPFHYSIATRVRNPYFKRFLKPTSGDLILDIGCGVGYFSELLSALGGRIWGIDTDPLSITTASKTVEGQFALGRAESLPFRDNSFDKLLCSEVLEHILDDNQAISEIQRVAKQGATVVFTVPSPEGIFGAKIKSICHGHEGAHEGHGGEAHQRDGYTRKELQRLLEDHGIVVEEMRFTMIALAEILMGITKLAYSATSGKAHLASQSEVIQVSESRMLKTYGKALPIITGLARIEDRILAPLLKGHMLVVKGHIQK